MRHLKASPRLANKHSSLALGGKDMNESGESTRGLDLIFRKFAFVDLKQHVSDLICIETTETRFADVVCSRLLQLVVRN